VQAGLFARLACIHSFIFSVHYTCICISLCVNKWWWWWWWFFLQTALKFSPHLTAVKVTFYVLCHSVPQWVQAPSNAEWLTLLVIAITYMCNVITCMWFVSCVLACSCHPEGAVSRSCDQVSGQCRCREGVIGWQCDRCPVSVCCCQLGTAIMNVSQDHAATSNSSNATTTKYYYYYYYYTTQLNSTLNSQV